MKHLNSFLLLSLIFSPMTGLTEASAHEPGMVVREIRKGFAGDASGSCEAEAPLGNGRERLMERVSSMRPMKSTQVMCAVLVDDNCRGSLLSSGVDYLGLKKEVARKLKGIYTGIHKATLAFGGGHICTVTEASIPTGLGQDEFYSRCAMEAQDLPDSFFD